MQEIKPLQTSIQLKYISYKMYLTVVYTVTQQLLQLREYCLSKRCLLTWHELM